MDYFWIELWNTIEEGSIPLHLAVQLTPDHLAKMWADWMSDWLGSGREQTDNPAYVLMVVGLERELIARTLELLPTVFPDVPWLAESVDGVMQEARVPGTNPLLKDRLRATVARGPAQVWLTLRRGLETLLTPQNPKGVLWHRLRDFVEIARNLPHPPGQRPWIDDIIASLGPPTLEQIVAAAEIWRTVNAR